MKNIVESGRAISIRQPMVEEIFRGKKKYEYRSRPTNIRGRVYLYAAMGISSWQREYYVELGFEVGDLPTGVIVGTVEISGCVYFKKDRVYGYKLTKPRRFKKFIKPKMQPQPCWFFPFGRLKVNNSKKKTIHKKSR